jgi:hypothetical protein
VTVGEILAELHLLLSPQVYLQVGAGPDDALARSRSRTIVVDPHPAAGAPLAASGPWTKMFRATADAFFATYDRRPVLEGGELELALIDGRRPSAAVLREFAQVERWMSPHGVVAIEGILAPTGNPAPAGNGEVARHSVAAFVTALAESRPRLRLTLVSAAPAGLLLVANLDPGDEPRRRVHAPSGEPDERQAPTNPTPPPPSVRTLDPGAWLREVRRSLLV